MLGAYKLLRAVLRALAGNKVAAGYLHSLLYAWCHAEGSSGSW